jgi:hypothetical protein
MKYRNPMNFLTYKRHEENLQQRFGEVKISIKPIASIDMYYSDGAASAFLFKVEVDPSITIYMPDMVHRVSDEHKAILKEWMAYVEMTERKQD